MACLGLLMRCEHGERRRCGGRSELQVWGVPWRAPGLMGQMDVSHLRMFLLPGVTATPGRALVQRRIWALSSNQVHFAADNVTV